MLRNQLSLKYAQAMFELAAEKKLLETVGRELSDIEKTINIHTELKSFIYHPCVSAAAKKIVITQVFGEAGVFVRNFMFLLIDRHREIVFPEIVREYGRLYREARNIVEAEVITAMPLAKADQIALKSKLDAVTGKTVVIKPIVDAQIIGGVIIKMGDKLIDGSVKRQVSAMKAALLSFQVTKIGVTDLV